MIRTILIVLLLALTALIIADGSHRRANSPQPAAHVAPLDSSPQQPAPLQASAPRLPVIDVATASAPQTTPTIDMYARLAVRRRIVREGSRVYLDSILPHTDSIITRWFERRTLSVRAIPDTTVARWTPALLDDVRSAIQAWNATSIGPTLQEAGQSDSADIVVRWVDMLADSGLVGSTTVNWTHDGIIHGATVTLALRRNRDSIVVPASVRPRIAIHEFGHALGLPHSDNSDDIMFRTSPVAEPSYRDQATLRLLYVLFPGPLRIQP